jgi:GT2 family glycosyltransferase
MSHYTKVLITCYKYHGDKVREFPKNDFPSGGNAAYRASVFEKVGLFNVDLGRKGDSLAGAEEKDIFDKMTTLGMRFYYLPTAILYHQIPEKKLTKEYFDKLTYSIGQSERMRTLNIGKGKYAKRLVSEAIKWAASIVLCIGHTLSGHPAKGWKLIQFRWNVTKGLLRK